MPTADETQHDISVLLDPDTTPETKQAVHDKTDRYEMLRELHKNPVKFFQFRLNCDGVPWARVEFRKVTSETIEYRFSITRRDWVFTVNPASLRRRHFVETTETDCGEIWPGSHDYEDSFEGVFKCICRHARQFFGAGAYQWFEVLTIEQAWERIKDLQGLPVKGDPWEVILRPR